jgi:hypothetical protein
MAGSAALGHLSAKGLYLLSKTGRFASTATRRYKRPAVEAGLPANYYRANINEQGHCDDHPWPHAGRRSDLPESIEDVRSLLGMMRS